MKKSIRADQSFEGVSERSFKRYMEEVEGTLVLEAEEERELFRRYKRGDEAALEKIVRANQRFVISVVRQFNWSRVPIGDLIGAGNRALLMAARRFDETRGFKFISFAVKWIGNAMKDEVRKNYLVQMPQSLREDKRGVQKAEEKLHQKLGRWPTDEELVEEPQRVNI